MSTVTKEGYIYDGNTLIGQVKHVVGGWAAYVQLPNSLRMKYAGKLGTKREAIQEVEIMREV